MTGGPHPHSAILTLTPQLLARIQALGFDGAPSDALAWLVSGLEEQRTSARLSAAWNEGASAQCAGLPRHAVPYLPDSEDGAAWLAGWTADAWSPGGRLHRELAEDAEKLRRSRNFHVAHLNEIRAVLSDPSHVVDGGFDSAGKVAAMARELQAVKAARDEARATAEELRLILAAEQGKPEGAPSEDWQHQGIGTWHNKRTGAVVTRGGWPVTAPGESIWTLPNGTRGISPDARAAMKDVDKAMEMK